VEGAHCIVEGNRSGAVTEHGGTVQLPLSEHVDDVLGGNLPDKLKSSSQ
jgi:hypothetical protein